MAAPDGWEVPVEIGMHVELHSLSRDDLNGRRGEALAWDPAKARWAIHLIGDEKMAVRPINLKRAPPAAADVKEEAFSAAEEAAGLLSAIRQGEGPPAQLFQQAEALLAKAEQLDPAQVMLHQARGDAAHMQGRYAEQAKHARRAVANGHGVVASEDGRNYQNQRRMALAAALGNAGDLEGEVEQVRAVLAAEPGHVHARLTLGQSLLDRGEFEAAVPELLMALQLPDAAKPPWASMSPADLAMMRDGARDALVGAFGRRAQQLAARGEHRLAADMLDKRLLPLPRLTPDQSATASANLATSLCALGETTKAEQLLEAARARGGAAPLKRASVLTTSGHCKETLADNRRGGRAEVDETAAALYAEAKAFYREANALSEDPASRRGFTRVQAKVHPGMEWVPQPESGAMGDGRLGGFARATLGGVSLEELPPGPR